MILKEVADRRLSASIAEKYAEASERATILRVETLRKQVRDVRAKQWREDDTHTLNQLERVCHFTREEIKQFQAAFNQLMQQKKESFPVRQVSAYKAFSHQSVRLPMSLQRSASLGEAGIGITKSEFLTIVQRCNARMFEFASQLFDRYDEDRSGYLDFRELLVCLSLLSKGSFEERLRVCYDLFDYDHSGYLSSEELDLLIDSLHRHLLSTTSHKSAEKALLPVRSKLSLLLSSTGMVSWREFYNCVLSDRVVYTVFAQHLVTRETYSSGELLKAVAQRRPTQREAVGETRCCNCDVF